MFSFNKLNGKFIGSELGLFKDDLNGLSIKEGYFLGIKNWVSIFR